MIMSRQHIAWLPLLVMAVIAMLSHTLSVQQSNSRHPLVRAVQAYDGKSHDNAYKLSVATTIVRSPDRHGDRVTPTEPLWTRLRSGFALPTGRSGPVQAQLHRFTSDPVNVERILQRGSPYLYHILSEVNRRGLPTELALLPAVESAFDLCVATQ